MSQNPKDMDEQRKRAAEAQRQAKARREMQADIARIKQMLDEQNGVDGTPQTEDISEVEFDAMEHSTDAYDTRKRRGPDDRDKGGPSGGGLTIS